MFFKGNLALGTNVFVFGGKAGNPFIRACIHSFLRAAQCPPPPPSPPPPPHRHHHTAGKRKEPVEHVPTSKIAQPSVPPGSSVNLATPGAPGAPGAVVAPPSAFESAEAEGEPEVGGIRMVVTEITLACFEIAESVTAAPSSTAAGAVLLVVISSSEMFEIVHQLLPSPLTCRN